MTSSAQKAEEVKITLPVQCTYRGGHTALGKHGRHFWIKDGRVGYGEFHMTHSIPLSDVARVEVAERQLPGSEARTLMTAGNPMGYRGGPHARAPKQVTDIVVWTEDGQAAFWIVEDRSGEWVRDRLRTVLHGAGIPFHEDLPPTLRKGIGLAGILPDAGS
jgi:hypothetical protein